MEIACEKKNNGKNRDNPYIDGNTSISVANIIDFQIV